jgi:hypothetical protein
LNPNAWFALVTALVAATVMVVLGGQYSRKRRIYSLWWTIAFLVTAVAALSQFVAFAQGMWPAGLYRLYLILASVVPAFMGVGTMYLLASRRWANVYTVIIGLLTLLTIYGAASAALSAGALQHVLQAATTVQKVTPSPIVLIGFAVLGTLGAGAMVLGALVSAIRTRHIQPLLILLGGVVYSMGDTMAAYNLPVLFFLAQVVGVLLLYGGVRANRRPAEAPRPA